MSLLAFSGTPLAVLAANATFLLDNKELAPRTHALAEDMRIFFANCRFWKQFVADPARVAAVRNQWTDFLGMVPAAGMIVDAGGAARSFGSTAAMPTRTCTTPVPLELLFCLGTLAGELRMRPDVLERPLPANQPIVIDAETTVAEMPLRDLLALAAGTTIARLDYDPRLVAVALEPSGDVGVLTLLSAAIETGRMKADAWRLVVGAAHTVFALPATEAQRLVEAGYKLFTDRTQATAKLQIF